MKFVIRILFYIVNIIAVIALLCCFATQFINPNDTPYCEIIGLGFPIIYIINIFTAIAWLFSKEHKRFFLASFIPLLLCYPIVANYYAKAPNDTTKDSKESIKIVSYNVMGFNYLSWKNNDSVKNEVFQYIKKENPDIVCFQEFHDDKHEKVMVIDSLKQQLNLSFIHYDVTFSTGKNHFQGNVICSRYPIVATGEMEYQKTGNTTIWADIAIHDDTIRIFNNHLESYRLSKSDKETINDLGKAQNVEVDEVEQVYHKLFKAIEKRGTQTDELIYAIQNSKRPIICCGDFNAPACSYTYQAIRKSKKFKDAFLESGDGVGTTFNWWPQLRLDYILYDSEFDSYNFKRAVLQVSDHFPISCEISIHK